MSGPRLCILCGREIDIDSPDITVLTDRHRKTVRDGQGIVHVLATKHQTERRRQQQESPPLNGKE